MVLGKRQYHVAPKPSRDEDLTLPHLLVVGPTAPAPVNLLYEGGQLLKPQAPLFFQVEKLEVGGGGLVLACTTLQAPPASTSHDHPSLVSTTASQALQ